MKRSGFARPQYSSPSNPGTALTRTPDYSLQPYSGGGRPKEPRLECPHLLEMARRPQQTCLLMVKCSGGVLRDDCCAAHGNSLSFNKGMGMKAHDFLTVRACPVCHTWLDSSYSASYEERQWAFKDAYPRQVAEWRLIVAIPEPLLGAADWRAAAWALRHAPSVEFPV